MFWTTNLLLALAALVVEAAVGYPEVLYRVAGHPVTWMGGAIERLDRRFNRAVDPPARRRRAGALALVIAICLFVPAAAVIDGVLRSIWLGFAALVALAASLPAQRSLYEHAAAVARALEIGTIEEARRAVGKIVGRNVEALDKAGVCRAAIESLAENFSDGVVAPALWLVFGGLAGGVFYKLVNTADSMIGHRTSRHEAFGWAAARLDDFVNLPASRASAAFLICAAGPSRAGAALATVRSDARRHRSPNAGWPEAAMAGALGLALAGPRVYGRTLVADALMGDGRRDTDSRDLRAALRLYRRACLIQWAACATLFVVIARL